jgi:toxin YoeB
MNKQLVFKEKGWSDYLYWQTEDRKTLKRINQLIIDIDRNGNEGIGKPEELKHDLQGWWSRRINEKHRLVYRIDGDAINIAACRFHYDE